MVPLAIFLVLITACSPPEKELPNILWITSEDNSPLLGCYGDTFAITPNLDRLAGEGFLYTHAYANTPVCAPARNTILTGVYACVNGNEQMRSNYLRSEKVRPYTEFLLEEGYYCTNNSKTDYNTRPVDLDSIWDQCSREAHYRNRAEGQPFFAIFNITRSHESSIHTTIPEENLVHSPDKAPIPPYHPDTPEIRHDWAQYYDRVTQMDSLVGDLLDELDSLGLADNTIVFYYSDHGGVLGRSKRFLYETGTHVPLIIRIPEKYKDFYPAAGPGSEVDRLVSFVDLAPTLLSLAGEEAPGYMQGRAFLGEHVREPHDYIYMYRDRMDERYDLSRSIVDGKFRYTRNYNPGRIYLQHLDYLWRAPSMRSWEEACLNGECNEVQARWWGTKPAEELYLIEEDPWEVNNLAGDPAYGEQLERMRKAHLEIARSVLDAGFIPEADRQERAGETAVYDYMRKEAVPLGEITEAALAASSGNPANLERFTEWMNHEDGAVRYWAARGMLLLGAAAGPALESVKKAAEDPFLNVSAVGAETLYRLGYKEEAIDAFRRVLESDNPMARTFALNCIDHMGGTPGEFLDLCTAIIRDYQELDRGSQYDIRMLKWLFTKWEINPAGQGVEFPW